MGLRATLFVMAILLSGADSTKSQAYFNETGELPCHFTNPQNLSLDELVAFWQDQDKLVLYESYGGREKPTNVHPNYRGRASLDQESWTLRLHNVQIKDMGSYQCFIHHLKGPQGMVSIHQMNIDLSVLANFSQPEMLISNRTENSDIINLTCSSVQGYPKPKKMFLRLTTPNSTTEYDAVMNIYHSNITELYNVSISLSFPVSPETNVSILCVLQPASAQEELLSLPYNIDAKPQKPPQRDPYTDSLPVMILPLLFVIVCLILSVGKLRKRKKKQPSPSHECEVLRAEGEESAPASVRVENCAPERSEDAQGAVNVSKTASGDRSATHFN